MWFFGKQAERWGLLRGCTNRPKLFRFGFETVNTFMERRWLYTNSAFIINKLHITAHEVNIENIKYLTKMKCRLQCSLSSLNLGVGGTLMLFGWGERLSRPTAGLMDKDGLYGRMTIDLPPWGSARWRKRAVLKRFIGASGFQECLLGASRRRVFRWSEGFPFRRIAKEYRKGHCRRYRRRFGFFARPRKARDG